VLNKAAHTNHEELMRVYGTLMWKLGEVFGKAEVIKLASLPCSLYARANRACTFTLGCSGVYWLFLEWLSYTVQGVKSFASE
jgi:hypothetical protein